MSYDNLSSVSQNLLKFYGPSANVGRGLIWHVI